MTTNSSYFSEDDTTAVLCGQCYYRIGGESYAFVEPSGVWIHHDCGLRLGNDEIARRGLSLEPIASPDGGAPSPYPYLNTNPQAVENSAGLGDRFVAGAGNGLRRQYYGSNNTFVQNAFIQFQQTKRVQRKQAKADQETLHMVNEERAHHGLPPVPDVYTLKRMPTMLSMIPAPEHSHYQKEGRGACFWIFIIFIMFIVGVPVLGTLAGILDIMGY